MFLFNFPPPSPKQLKTHKKTPTNPTRKKPKTSFSTELLLGSSLNDGLVSLRQVQVLERSLLIK